MIKERIKYISRVLLVGIVWVLVLSIPIGKHNLHFFAEKILLENPLSRKLKVKTSEFTILIQERWMIWYSSIDKNIESNQSDSTKSTKL